MIDLINGGSAGYTRVNEYDFIKGIAILSVITHHLLLTFQLEKTSFLQFHVGQAVPLFLLVSILLRFRKLDQKFSFF